MANTALDFMPLNFEGRARRQLASKAGASFLDRLKFRPPGTPNGDAARIHRDKAPVSAVYREMRGRLRANLVGLRKRRGKA